MSGLIVKLNHMLSVRKLPKCYILSSKIILITFVLLFTYFFVMDAILFVKMRRGESFLVQNTKKFKIKSDNSPKETNVNSMLDKLIVYKASIIDGDQFASTGVVYVSNSGDHDSSTKVVSIFSLLPVKKIMIAEATHFIRSPLAHFVEYEFNFSHHFPFITANMISVFHCLLSFVCIKFLIDNDLYWRQVGVCLFQFRNFLDSFDGVIYRALANKTSYKSHYGSLGYMVDSSSDVIGGICLIVAVGIYLLKNPPANRNPSCFGGAHHEPDKMNLLNDTYVKSSSDQAITLLHRYGVNTTPIKLTIVVSTVLFGIRFGLSGLFWDRSVHAYEDLLDCTPRSSLHQVYNYLLRNRILWFIYLTILFVFFAFYLNK